MDRIIRIFWIGRDGVTIKRHLANAEQRINPQVREAYLGG